MITPATGFESGSWDTGDLPSGSVSVGDGLGSGTFGSVSEFESYVFLADDQGNIITDDAGALIYLEVTAGAKNGSIIVGDSANSGTWLPSTL